MATALFITEQYLKDTSFIDDNIDMKLLQSFIKEAQDLHIHPILGTGLFNEISTQVTSPPVSAQNTTLLDSYIQPALKYWTLFEAAPFISFAFTNKSIMKKNAENAQPIDMGDVQTIMSWLRDKAEWYSERITRYLAANTTTFTLYVNPGSTSDTIYPVNTSYDCGIFLGNSGKKPSSFEEKYQGNGRCDED